MRPCRIFRATFGPILMRPKFRAPYAGKRVHAQFTCSLIFERATYMQFIPANSLKGVTPNRKDQTLDLIGSTLRLEMTTIPDASNILERPG